MNYSLLKSSFLAAALCCVSTVETYGADVAKFSFDSASDPTLTLDGSNGDRGTANYDYNLNGNTFLNVWGENNFNGSKVVTLTSDNLVADEVEWTLEFDWAGYSGCNGKAGYTQIRDIDGNTILSFDDAAAWGSTFTISAGGTLSCYPCNKSTRISAKTGSVLTAEYWHHVKVVGNATGVKLYVQDYAADGTLNSAYTIDGATVSASNASPASIALRPGSCGSVAINDLVLSKETKEISTVDYTVKFVCGDKEVKASETRKGIGGEAVALNAADKDAFLSTDNIKYYYVSDDAATITPNADGSSVVTVTYRQAYEYKYAVESNLGTTVAAGSSIEGESVKVGYPHYILQDGTLYSKGATNKEYSVSFTPDADGYTYTLDGYAESTSDVVYYSEAEDIEGLTVNTYGNVAVRASKALAALAAEDTKITTLPAGKYVIHAGVFSSSSNPSYTIKIKVGEETLEAPVATVNASEVALTEVELKEETDVTLLAEGMDKNCLLDYIYIVKTGVVTAINGVAETAGAADDAIYTINGMKVEKAEKGIYIINGKKYIK